MSRPIPTWPRGPRRRRARLPQALLACPRVSPEWELSTLAALMRPTAARRGKVEHLGGGQPPFPVDAERLLGERLSLVGGRLGVDLAAWDIQFPALGEYFLVGQVPAELESVGRAVAVALSVALPEHWFVVGRLFVRAGRFHRRRRGYRLELVPATDVHVPRDVRAKLRGIL